MSTLLEQASLVMIPSGYKEDVVYSQIPTSGAGDLSFTRASNGTRINSAGLVEVCPWNLLEQSENFDSGTWSKTGVTVTANTTTAPNGTTTADTLVFGASSNEIVQSVGNLVVDQTYTLTIYLRVASGTATMYWGNIDYTTPTITVTTEWQRFTVTQQAAATTRYPKLVSSSAMTVFAWGAQLNIGSTAKPYFSTTDRLNVPRLTYQNGGGGCPSLLLEPQRTNLVSYSEQFDNAAWSAYLATVTANNGISPDGTQNADLVYPSSTGALSGQLFRQISSGISSGNVVTISAFVKASGKNFAYLSQIQNSFSPDAYFNLTTGAITNISSGVTASMTQLTNSWWRISITSTAGAGSYYAVVGSTDSAGSITNTASGTNGILVYGYQVEVGAYPTSYIPTTSSSATRVADACFKTGISSLIGQTSGSVFFDFTVDAISAQTNDPVLWYMKDVGAGERYMELYSNGNLVYAEYTTSSIVSITKAGLTVGRHKCAIAYATDDFVFYVDGVQVGTDTSGTPNGYNTFGLQYYTSNYQGQQKVNQCAIFKTRLTNAELASLTTI